MNEYIIPLGYTGQGAGLAVMFTGLESDAYEKLELSIDGYDFFEVKRDEEDISCSHPHIFQQLIPGQIYKVVGRIAVDGDIFKTKCMIPAMHTQSTPNLKARNIPRYHGGGMSKPMSRPKEGYKDIGNN